MMLGKKIPVNHPVVLGDPTETVRALEVPKVNVGIHDGDVRLAERKTKQAKAACGQKKRLNPHQPLP
jgi:hypothetical protein